MHVHGCHKKIEIERDVSENGWIVKCNLKKLYKEIYSQWMGNCFFFEEVESFICKMFHHFIVEEKFGTWS